MGLFFLAGFLHKVRREKGKNMHNKQQGYGILAVVIMTVVLGTVLAASMVGGTSTTSMLSNNNVAQTITAQAGLIRSRILQCGTEYPSGNNATGFRVTYPAAAAITNVSALTCPGSALNLWTQSDGVFMPTVPSDFNAWQYTNDVTSIRLSITSTTTDRTAILPTIARILGAQALVAGSTLTWTIAQ